MNRTCTACHDQIPNGHAHIRSVRFVQVAWCHPCWVGRELRAMLDAEPMVDDTWLDLLISGYGRVAA